MHIKAQDDLTAAASQLPLIIRERDTEYQFYRIVIYDRLLQVSLFAKIIKYTRARTIIPMLTLRVCDLFWDHCRFIR